jgi:TetR/AcrR family transcriptional regulator, transcriptional repressor for nem operon
MVAPKSPRLPSKKERTRARIVQSAAQAIRRAGYEGVSVADIMKDAGLTHGGFYAHFPSREALLVEALDRASEESLHGLEAVLEGCSGKKALEALAEQYLSDAHAKHPESGCTLAGLGSETRRQSAEVRGVASRRVRQMLELIERQLAAGEAARRERAMAIVSMLVGALLISRVVSNAELGKSFRAAALRHVRSLAG